MELDRKVYQMSQGLTINRPRRAGKLATLFFAAFALFVQPLVALNVPAAFAAGLDVTPSEHINVAGSDTGPVEVTSSVTAADYENLNLKFDYDIGNLEASGDTFTYGWRVGGSDTDLETIDGQTGNPGTDEEGSVDVSLPNAAATDDLVLYFVNESSATNDSISITNIAVSGDAVVTSTAPVIGTTTPVDGETIYKSDGTYTISAEVTDADSDLDEVKWALTGPVNRNSDQVTPAFTNTSGNTWSGTYNLSNLPVGSYDLTFTAKDVAGNETTKTVSNVKLESARPASAVTNTDTGDTFNTIQAAIDASNTDDGDTIEVSSGTYDEDVQIDKSISLTAPNGATINGQSGRYAVELKGALNGVTFSGFTVNGSAGQEALKVEQGSLSNNVTIANNTFVSGDDGHAVYAGKMTNSTFEDNIFKTNSGEEPVILVYLQGASSNVDFINNTFSGDLGNHLAFSTSASGSEFSGNNFANVTANGKDKLVEIAGTTTDSSGAGNTYPDGWAAVNPIADNFKGVYQLQKAVDTAANGDNVALTSDITIDNDLDISSEGITINGGGHMLVADFAKDGNQDNSAIDSDNVSNFTINNLLLEGSNSDQLHGFNLYKGGGIVLNDVTVNNFQYGLLANGSKVVVNNFATSGNTWAPIGLQQSSTSSMAEVTATGTSSHAETEAFIGNPSVPDGFQAHVWVTNENVATFIDQENQYDMTDYGTSRGYVLKQGPDPSDQNQLNVSGTLYRDNKLNDCDSRTECLDRSDDRLANWDVRLYKDGSNSTWDEVQSVLTNGSGVYKFGAQKEAGTYYVCFVQQAGWKQSKQTWSGSGYKVDTPQNTGDSSVAPYCAKTTYDDTKDRSWKQNIGNVDNINPVIDNVEIQFENGSESVPTSSNAVRSVGTNPDSIDIEASDEGSGIEYVRVALSKQRSNGTWSYLGDVKKNSDKVNVALTEFNNYDGTDGKYRFFIQARDNAGNQSNPNIKVDFAVDNTRPQVSEVTITPMTVDNEIGGTVKVKMKITDATDVDLNRSHFNFKLGTGSQSQNYKLTAVTGGYYEATLNTRDFVPFGSSESNYRLYVRTEDSLGNKGAKYEVTNIAVDNEAPTMSDLKFYVNGDEVDGKFVKPGDMVRVEVLASDAASGIDKVEFRIQAQDGQYVVARIYDTTAVDGNKYSYEFEVPEDGIYYNTPNQMNQDRDGHKYWVRAYDSVGNYHNGLKDNFTFDDTKPKITVKPGFVGDESSKTFSEVSFKLYDKHKIDYYTINGEKKELGDNEWSDANFQNFKQHLNEGSANTIVLYDVAGNPSDAYVFTYDNTEPGANAGSDQTVEAKTAQLSGTSDDINATFSWVLTDGPGTADFGDENSADTNVTVTDYGTYTFTLTTEDDADNTSTDNVTVVFNEPATTGGNNGNNNGNNGDANSGQPSTTSNSNNNSSNSGQTSSSANTVAAATSLQGNTLGAAPFAAVTPNLGLATTQANSEDGDGEILGAQNTDVAATDKNGEVLAATDEQDGCWKIFGLCWYWWVPILIAVFGIAWLIAAARRRRDDEDLPFGDQPPRRR